MLGFGKVKGGIETMKLHLTRKGQAMFSPNEDNIPIHWVSFSEPQKKILDCLHQKGDINDCWDETALQILIDIKMVKYD